MIIIIICKLKMSVAPLSACAEKVNFTLQVNIYIYVFSVTWKTLAKWEGISSKPHSSVFILTCDLFQATSSDKFGAAVKGRADATWSGCRLPAPNTKPSFCPFNRPTTTSFILGCILLYSFHFISTIHQQMVLYSHVVACPRGRKTPNHTLGNPV